MLKDLIKSHKYTNNKWEIFFFNDGKVWSAYQKINDIYHGSYIYFGTPEEISFIGNYINNNLNIEIYYLSGKVQYLKRCRNGKTKVINLSMNPSWSKIC